MEKDNQEKKNTGKHSKKDKNTEKKILKINKKILIPLISFFIFIIIALVIIYIVFLVK